jgi:hypothetical protein
MNINELGLTEEQLASVQKYVQSETDKVRTDYSQKLRTANDELNKYKPKEKTQEELDLETRIRNLEQKEAELSAKEKNVRIKSKLEEKGLPVALADYLRLENDEDIDKVGGELANYFLNNGVKPTNHAKSQPVTREQFRKMSYAQRAQLYQDNPELYKVLSK